MTDAAGELTTCRYRFWIVEINVHSSATSNSMGSGSSGILDSEYPDHPLRTCFAW